MDAEGAVVVVVGGWGGGGSPRRCRMIKAAIGDSGIGRVWVEIRGE